MSDDDRCELEEEDRRDVLYPEWIKEVEE